MHVNNDGPARTICLLCDDTARPFFEIPAVPLNISQLYEDAACAAAAPTGAIAMAACDSCGAIFNAAWDPDLISYDVRYENSLDASPTFNDYALSLARRLATCYPLSGAPIFEIGCGQATFLRTISEITGCEGFGFDPSYIGPSKIGQVTVQRRLCQPEDIASGSMVICRHVLEHFARPREFLLGLARVAHASSDTTFYFEVPNAESIFNGGVPWDIIYPHVSYFTARSLNSLFSRCGFRVLNIGTSYAGQFLFIEARVDSVTGEYALPPAAAEFDRFPVLLSSIVSRWASILAEFHANRTRVAFWGAGAKGVTFLNTVPGARAIRCVVDLNPRKQGTFVPGTGQLICAPEDLRGFDPGIVITPNPIYAAEIRTRLADLHCSALLLTGAEFAAMADGPALRASGAV